MRGYLGLLLSVMLMNVWVAYPYLLPQSYHNHSALHAAARPPETPGPKTGPHAVARAG